MVILKFESTKNHVNPAIFQAVERSPKSTAHLRKTTKWMPACQSVAKSKKISVVKKICQCNERATWVFKITIFAIN